MKNLKFKKMKEKIKKNIVKFKEWFLNESKKVSEVCKGNNIKENYRTWALWCKQNVSKNLLPIYLLMVEQDSLLRLDKKIEFFTTKKNGYESFKRLLTGII